MLSFKLTANVEALTSGADFEKQMFNNKLKLNGMKKLNLTTVSRTCVSALLVAVLLSSCGGKDTIYVWNMKDIIGLWIFGIIVVILALVFAYAWIADKINDWKRKRKRSQHSH